MPTRSGDDTSNTCGWECGRGRHTNDTSSEGAKPLACAVAGAAMGV
ncbi:hypothetical protein ACFQVC_08155 [Streptomyces monticola]|uniref:Uncharacterized protein n=1 Tax=Streptomyces monticola TaxID=2666263 RepID=A0ABW2JDU4_9ACTN